SASLYDEAKNHAADFGVRLAGVELDFPGIVKFRDKVVFKGAKGVEYLMKKNKVDVYAGLGRLVSPNQVAVKGDARETVLNAKNVLIATGSDFPSRSSRYGTKTGLVEVLPRFLPVEDEEISKEVERLLLLALRHEDR